MEPTKPEVRRSTPLPRARLVRAAQPPPPGVESLAGVPRLPVEQAAPQVQQPSRPRVPRPQALRVAQPESQRAAKLALPEAASVSPPEARSQAWRPPAALPGAAEALPLLSAG